MQYDGILAVADINKGQYLSRDRRLCFRWQFLKFFEGSEKYLLSDCIIFRRKNDEGHFRLGITLKAKGTSVMRNKIKRRIRETFRGNAEALGSYDYNVVVPASKKLDLAYSRLLSKRLGIQVENHLLRP